jgi:hypothetical protein
MVSESTSSREQPLARIAHNPNRPISYFKVLSPRESRSGRAAWLAYNKRVAIKQQTSRGRSAEAPGWDLGACVFGSSRLELADFVHAVRHEPRTMRLIRWATAVGLLACLLGLLLLRTALRRSGWLLLGLGVLCFAAHDAPEQIARRWFARTPQQARNLRYTLNPQGLIVASDVTRQLYAWPDLYGFQPVPEALLVWVSAHLFLIIPKRAFSFDDLPRAIQEFERRVGAPPPLPRFWSWLLLAIALAVLLLALWNRFDPR